MSPWRMEEPSRKSAKMSAPLSTSTAISSITGWWFGTFFIFPYIGNNHRNWLIFFRGVETTNQHKYWEVSKRLSQLPELFTSSLIGQWWKACCGSQGEGGHGRQRNQNQRAYGTCGHVPAEALCIQSFWLHQERRCQDHCAQRPVGYQAWPCDGWIGHFASWRHHQTSEWPWHLPLPPSCVCHCKGMQRHSILPSSSRRRDWWIFPTPTVITTLW